MSFELQDNETEEKFRYAIQIRINKIEEYNNIDPTYENIKLTLMNL